MSLTLPIKESHKKTSQKKLFRVALLSAANVGHTINWANLLVEQGCEVHLISLHSYDASVMALNKKVRFHKLGWAAPQGYLFAALELRWLLNRIQPDVLNAHYATGYGLLARLARTAGLPYLLSVWGTDVYEFPSNSFKRWLLKGNLRAATAIGSTSVAMAEQTRKTFNHPCIQITPFGVDTELFKPQLELKQKEQIVIGTVKSLHHRYGVDRLLKVFAAVRERLPPEMVARLVLKVFGCGPAQEALVKQSQELGIHHVTEFLGHIPHSEVPAALASFDVYVALSRYESFGVAILEANSCEIATLVSNAEGPAEVVLHEKTGLIAENDEQAIDYLQQLITNETYRNKLGRNGREHILNLYSKEKCTAVMVQVLKNLQLS